MTPTYVLRLAKVSMKDNLENFFKMRGRSHSTFNKFVDEDLEIARGYRE